MPTEDTTTETPTVSTDTNDQTSRFTIGDEPFTFVFMCVRNAGRSQMATAFAERERERRGLTDNVEIITGGTQPADAVHDVVVEALAEVDLDVGGRTPRHVSEETLAGADFIATMGCSTFSLDGLTTEDWALTDPGERPIADVRPIRDEIERQVVALFDRIESPESTTA